MNPTTAHARPAVLLAPTLLAAFLGAQIPDGHLVWSSLQGTAGQNGIFHSHPRDPFVPVGAIRNEGREVHTLVAADVSAAHAGDELLAFTSPGALFVGVPRADADGFDFTKLEELPGRVRDAVLLPRERNGPVEIATASRSGRIELFRFVDGAPQHVLIHGAPMGAGRITLRPPAPGQPLVLYTTRDDGSIWRHERRAADEWANETIYLGPQGPRGIAAGRFDQDPAVETVLICGYSSKVELLRADATGWRAETVFEDRDKCHWVARAELDSRNTTDEAVVTGYGGRIVLLSRPPGHGLPNVLAATRRP